jgi:hypothetical protein
VLLIVMYEKGTWRVRPSERFTFGREATCTAVLPANDLGISRSAGSLVCEHDLWWLSNDSSSSMLYLTADLGFRVDLPPGMRTPIEHWHAKVRLNGMLGSYTLRLRLPHLDSDDDAAIETSEPSGAEGAGAAGSAAAQGAAAPGSAAAREPTNPHERTSTRNRAPLTDGDRLVLAARFEEYLDWKHVGEPAPRSAKQAAERIGWDPHTVTKRCENIRNRYARHGVAELRGPRALEELAALLISTGELTADDLRRLPPLPPSPPAASASSAQ